MRKPGVILGVVLTVMMVGVAAFAFRGFFRQAAASVVQRARGRATVEERLQQFGAAARSRMAHDFERLALSYPPERVVLIGLKRERNLEVWGCGAGGPWRLLKTYPILGASGTLGPKLRQGDGQVPEGVYRIESLNPNSLYHVALRVNYPNEFDRAKGALDGRDILGGDIMIHGKTCSIGCLAMGDEAAEELFTLAAETGVSNVSVVLSPVDFRLRGLPPGTPEGPSWVPELYSDIRQALSELGKTIPSARAKVELDLQSIGADGLRGPANGKVAVSYEFAIPNTDACKAEVKAIDATVEFMPGLQGRIRAPKSGCLCIGSTHQDGYREVLKKLAELPYVERIVECHFE